MLTVILATRDGGDTLAEALPAYRKLQPPEGGFKLVIVDNGSRDGTAAVIEEFQAELPLTYVFEGRAGKNAALNTGLRHAEGDLIVLTDDDIVPGVDWLVDLRRAADTAPDYAIFGGPVVPRWPSPPPDWLLKAVPLGPVFAVSPPLPSGAVAPWWIFGGNMAVRRAIFALGIRFDATIGPCGRHYAQGSEAELTARLHRAGFKTWYCAGAVVEHLIRPEHMTEAWILSRARRYGRGQQRLVGSEQRRFVIPGLGVPLQLTVRLAKQALRIARARMRRNPAQQFEAAWWWNYLLGAVQESHLIYQQRRLGPAEPSSRPEEARR